MKQKIILITGASSGFGLATSQMLRQKGHIVYGTSRKESKEEFMLKMDVTQKEDIANVIESIFKKHGRIDTIINNAGMGISGALEMATDDEINRQMGTNFMGCVNVCQIVLPYMRKCGGGHIINISSIAGVTAVPFQGFYSASKFAIEGFSEALALETRSFGIKISIVEPGDFSTGFTGSRIISQATIESEAYGKVFAKTMKQIEEEEMGGCKPIKLAKAITKLVESKHPKFRIIVGPLVQVFFAKIQNILPASLNQALLRFFYHL